MPITIEAVYEHGVLRPTQPLPLEEHETVRIPRLAEHVHAIARIPVLGIQILAMTYPLVETATLASRQFELLTGTALVVAVMQGHGLTHLVSNDADFDRVPGLIRYSPI